MADSLKWSSERIITFLDMYRKYECLWDIRSPAYLKRDAKRAAYSRLLSDLEEAGLSANEDTIKRKAKNLRDTYRSELNKVKKSKKSGDGADNVYKPKLAWYTTADAFLNSVISGRDSSSVSERRHCLLVKITSCHTSLTPNNKIPRKICRSNPIYDIFVEHLYN